MRLTTPQPRVHVEPFELDAYLPPAAAQHHTVIGVVHQLSHPTGGQPGVQHVQVDVGQQRGDHPPCGVPTTVRWTPRQPSLLRPESRRSRAGTPRWRHNEDATRTQTEVSCSSKAQAADPRTPDRCVRAGRTPSSPRSCRVASGLACRPKCACPPGQLVKQRLGVRGGLRVERATVLPCREVVREGQTVANRSGDTAHVEDRDGLVGRVDLVQNAVAADADPP
jgi:hypothetical protein